MREGWMYKKLSEACQINCGTRVVQKKDGGTIYPVYGGGGATFKMDTYNREDCLVVARFAMSKQCTRFVKGKFFLNDSGLTISSNDSALNQNYLDKVIVSLNDNIYNSGKGVAQKNLDMKEFKNLQIPIPPLTTQQQIVSELDLVSHILDQKRQQLKEYDALAESIFYDMFGDPVENPKGWELKNLKSVCTKITDGSHNPPNGIGKSDYLMLSSKNVTFDGFTFDEPRFLTKEQFEAEDKRTNVQYGDVFLVIVGAGVGKCCIYNNNKPITLQRSVAVLGPDNRILESQYLNWFFIFSHDFICNEAKGAAQKGIYLKQLSAINIPLPPLNLQRSFAAKIESIEHQKQLLRASIKETEMLFQSRMDYWFNG